MKSWLAIGRLARDKPKMKSRAGYTITEVMVVLAVSAVMFAAVALLFRGRQAEAQFTQSMRNFEAKIQNVINDVGNGYYSSGFRCSASSSSDAAPSFSFGTATQQGTNSGCVFLGKIVDVEGETSNVLTVVGRRTHFIVGSGTSRNVDNLAESRASVVDRADGNVTDVYAHSYGLDVRRIVRLSDTTIPVAAFGFIRAPGGVSAGSSTSVKLYGVVGQPADTTPKGDIINAIQTNTQFEELGDGILICLVGGNGRGAEMRIGENQSHTGINTVLGTENDTGACDGV